MHEAEIVDFRKEGLWVNYYLNKEMDIEIEQENAREKLIKRGYKFKSETDHMGVKKLK